MVNAARAQQARTRARLARIERQVTARDAKRPALVARAGRIRGAKRDLKRALRARDAAQCAGHASEVAAGGAIRRLRNEGLVLSDVAALCGLSLKVVRRFLRLAGEATASDTASPSTAAPADRASIDLVGERRATAVPQGADSPRIEEGSC